MEEQKSRIIESLKKFGAIERRMPLYWISMGLLKKGYKKESALLFYPRLFPLALIYYSNNGGTTYSEIKKDLNVSDMSLRLNLKWLEQQGYVTARESGEESVYRVTEEGRRAYKLVHEKLVGMLRIGGIEARHVSL